MRIISKFRTEIRFLQPQYYVGRSKMIWTYLISSKSVIFGWMDTKQLLTKRTPLLCLHRRHLMRIIRTASRNHLIGVLLYRSWTAVCAVFLPLLRLRSQLNTVLRAGVFSQHNANNRDEYLTVKCHRSVGSTRFVSVHEIAFHFATLVHALPPLYKVMT